MSTNVVTILVSAAVCVVGALMYALASNGKVQEMGRLAFFVGLFWLVAEFARSAVHV